MKNILVCLIFTVAVLLTLPQPLFVCAQKKEEKSGKDPASETDQLSPEQAEMLLKEFKKREETVSRLKFQTGEIKLKDGVAGRLMRRGPSRAMTVSS